MAKGYQILVAGSGGPIPFQKVVDALGGGREIQHVGQHAVYVDESRQKAASMGIALRCSFPDHRVLVVEVSRQTEDLADPRNWSDYKLQEDGVSVERPNFEVRWARRVRMKVVLDALAKGLDLERVNQTLIDLNVEELAPEVYSRAVAEFGDEVKAFHRMGLPEWLDRPPHRLRRLLR